MLLVVISGLGMHSVNFFLFVCLFYSLEQFTTIHQETLSDLTTLVNYPKASSMKAENLLKCMAINIFTIHNILEKQGQS